MHIEQRVQVLTSNLEQQLTLLYSIDNSILYSDDPIQKSKWTKKREDCEKLVLEEAFGLADLAEKYPEIDEKLYFSDQIAAICKKYADRLSEADKNELFISINAKIELAEKEIKASGASGTSISATSKNSLELTIPIIPAILSYKTSLTLDTSMSIKNLVKKLLGKIKEKLA